MKFFLSSGPGLTLSYYMSKVFSNICTLFFFQIMEFPNASFTYLEMKLYLFKNTHTVDSRYLEVEGTL